MSGQARAVGSFFVSTWEPFGPEVTLAEHETLHSALADAATRMAESGLTSVHRALWISPRRVSWQCYGGPDPWDRVETRHYCITEADHVPSE